MSKIRRRKREGQAFYRPDKKTLSARVRKKLLEKTTWYKRERSDDEEEGQERQNPNTSMRSPRREKGGTGGTCTRPGRTGEECSSQQAEWCEGSDLCPTRHVTASWTCY